SKPRSRLPSSQKQNLSRSQVAVGKSHCRQFAQSRPVSPSIDRLHAKCAATAPVKVSSDAGRPLNSSFHNPRAPAPALSSEAKVKQQGERPLLPVQRQCGSHLGPDRRESFHPLSHRRAPVIDK